MAAKIEDNDIIFLGTGTTTELVYDYLDVDNLKIITNSIFVFDKFKNDDHYDLILIGGNYRSLTGAFIGTIASDFIKNIYIQKAFIGVNALDENYLYNSTIFFKILLGNFGAHSLHNENLILSGVSSISINLSSDISQSLF